MQSFFGILNFLFHSSRLNIGSYDHIMIKLKKSESEKC